MGTEDLFQCFYEKQFDAVFRAALVLGSDRALAEDATQEAFARALEKWKRLRSEERVAGWVMVTALNVVRRALRRRAVLPWTKDEADVDPDASVDLWQAVRKLSRRQQEAIVLRYVADMPIKEVAEAMGCKVGSVKAHIHRAKMAPAKTLDVPRHDESGSQSP